jgi:L-fuconolactonase
MRAANPRRRFLQQTAALTVATGLSATSAADDQATMPIADTHQHLWDLSRFTLPWLKGASKRDRSSLMKDYLQATDGLNIG